MHELQKCRSIVYTETILFTRSWVFRFLTLATCGFLVFLNLWMFFTQSTQSAWMLKNISSTIPYINFLFLAVTESLIVMFGAVESMNRDYHNDTAQSLHARNMTNIAYTLSKALGVMAPCVVLNLIIGFFVLALNVYIENAAVVWQAYFIYPFLISLPTLVFITGISFMVASVVKSLPLALLILLGMFAIPFMYFDSIPANLFDFAAMHLPFIYSSIVGTDNLTNILLQRVFFICLGFGGIMGAAYLFRRLPQSKQSRRLSSGLAVGFFGIAMVFGAITIGDSYAAIRLRDRIRALNEEYVSKPRACLNACDLDIVHDGSELEINARLTLINHRDIPLESLAFSLNPGFTIRSVTDGDAELDFTRNTQIIDVSLPAPLEPGGEIVLDIDYDGRMDNDACYPDITEEERIHANRFFTCVIPKRFGFIKNDYVLLTPECQWYPTPGIPYGLVFPDAYERDFTDFALTLTTRDDLTVVSQGEVEKTGAGTFAMSTDTKLPGLTLAVGRYLTRAAYIDSMTAALHHLPGHDYFMSSIEIIPELMERFERTKISVETSKGMPYPFTRFAVLEAPVQLYTYERPSKTYLEIVQPGLSILPEKGFNICDLNIAGSMTSRIKQEEADGHTPDLAVLSTTIVSSRISNILQSDQQYREDIQRAVEERLSRLEDWKRHLTTDLTWQRYTAHYQPGYTFSPQFSPFVISFESPRYPALNAVIEYYRKYGVSINAGMDLDRLNYGIVDEEIACMTLEHQSFADYLDSSNNSELLQKILAAKAAQLFGTLPSYSGIEDPASFITRFTENNLFEHISFEQFVEALGVHAGFDFEGFMDAWYYDTELPMHVIQDASITEILDDEQIRYQILLTITNTESVSGAVYLEVTEVFNGTTMPESDSRIVTIEGNQSKQIGIVFDSEVQDIAVNTIFSQNLPIKFVHSLGTLQQDYTMKPFDGERIVEYSPPKLDESIIVVDNMDDGFKIVSDPADIDDGMSARLYHFGRAPDGIIPPMIGMPPKRWGKSIITGSYGARSTAVYAKGGDGDGSVVWQTDIPEAGRYDLEFYLMDVNNPEYARINFPLSEGDAQKPLLADYNLTIAYSGDEDKIILMPRESQPGWQYVASFDLEPGETTVTLSNKSDGRLVYADAIRWVRK